MLKQRAFIVELIVAAGLIAAPFVLPYLDFSPNTINRILVWALFGLGFDILFGYTGLLSFGQSAFFGTGGMVAAYLLTVAGFPSVMTAVFIGTIVAAIVGFLVGLIALRRTGIYFAMITVAIAEVFYFIEFNPLSAYTGGENGLPGVPTPSLYVGFTTIQFNSDWSMYAFLAFWYFIGIAIALRIVRSPVGHILSAIRENPLRAQAVGHNIHSYKLTAFVVAAAYAGFAGGLLGLMQGFMPPDAFTFDTSGQLVMQTAIGGAGTLFGPLVGAVVWLYLSDFFQTTLHLGATWKLVLGLVFVLLVVFLRHGIVGGLVDLAGWVRRGGRKAKPAEPDVHVADDDDDEIGSSAAPAALGSAVAKSDMVLQATGLSKRYGGVVANDDINFAVQRGELRGIIGPNGAGKSTFFKMLTCEIHPTAGQIRFEGQDITGFSVTQVCQLGLTKSYQVNQLFNRLTVRENITIAALAQKRGPFKLDLLRDVSKVEGLERRVEETLALVHLTKRAEFPVSELAYGEKRRLEIGLALATSPSLLLLDEPLAGMSPRERVETVKLLKAIGRGRTMIVIDHDMDAIFELAEKITVLREGSVLVEGTPEEIKANAAVQEAYLGGVHEA
jgi:branched-chain amino acid transport system permease protein